jgi:hypothetical protein
MSDESRVPTEGAFTEKHEYGQVYMWAKCSWGFRNGPHIRTEGMTDAMNWELQQAFEEIIKKHRDMNQWG